MTTNVDERVAAANSGAESSDRGLPVSGEFADESGAKENGDILGGSLERGSHLDGGLDRETGFGQHLREVPPDPRIVRIAAEFLTGNPDGFLVGRPRLITLTCPPVRASQIAPVE